MKKNIIVLLFSTVLLVGCGKATDEKVSSSESKADVQTSVVKEPAEDSSKTTESSESGQVVDKFDGQTDLGDGTMNLVDASGSTSDDKALPITIAKDATTVEVGIDTADINGDLESYLYVDGQLVGKKELGTSQEKIEIKDVPTAITEGEHKFQLVQYEDDVEGGTIVTFKEKPFTIVFE